MEKIITDVDQKTAKELMVKSQIWVIVALVMGAICISLYFVFSNINNSSSTFMNVILLVLGGLLILLSIFYEILIQKKILLYKKNSYRSIYEFREHDFKLEAFRNDKKFQENIFKYNEISFYWESKNYVLINLASQAALPIKKVDGLTNFLESKGVRRK